MQNKRASGLALGVHPAFNKRRTVKEISSLTGFPGFQKQFEFMAPMPNRAILLLNALKITLFRHQGEN
jgi:hypothetical protein